MATGQAARNRALAWLPRRHKLGIGLTDPLGNPTVIPCEREMRPAKSLGEGALWISESFGGASLALRKPR